MYFLYLTVRAHNWEEWWWPVRECPCRSLFIRVTCEYSQCNQSLCDTIVISFIMDAIIFASLSSSTAPSIAFLSRSSVQFHYQRDHRKCRCPLVSRSLSRIEDQHVDEKPGNMSSKCPQIEWKCRCLDSSKLCDKEPAPTTLPSRELTSFRLSKEDPTAFLLPRLEIFQLWGTWLHSNIVANEYIQEDYNWPRATSSMDGTSYCFHGCGTTTGDGKFVSDICWSCLPTRQ